MQLATRATETPEDLALRLKNSFGEVERFSRFEYIVINDSVERAAGDLRAIILAERLRRDRQMQSIRVILDSFDTSKLETLGD